MKMNVEHMTVAIPLGDEKAYAEQVQKLLAEGWQLPPGVWPVAVYNLIRVNMPEDMAQRIRDAAAGKVPSAGPQPLAAPGGEVQMGVDPAKVGILRADTGNIEWGDGRIEKAVKQ